ncbi:MAG: 30S ribosomal protein S1, partial [Planctomycetota bacterium]
MGTHEVLRQIEAQRGEIEQELEAALDGQTPEELAEAYDHSIRNFEVGSILEGKVLNKRGDSIVIDIGYKSEGVVEAGEFRDHAREVQRGDKVEVLLEAVEDESGMVVLSKKKADRIRGWERVIADNQEGDIVRGTAIRKIKGGLLVDIGVPVFLPASQISIRRTGDIADYIGQELECKIIKIDKDRRNIVVSRRKLIEERREEQKKKLLAEIKIGELRKGVVKNITDFGAFIDLGGIDGLLHITDMSWGRISHPSEMLKIDEEVEVMILNVDYEKEKISLGLKQKTPSPWVGIETKYPVGSRIRGQVVNIMSYGAFVKLEDGVEGLVHISEMSWTRRINHPSELVAIGDTVEVVVLAIDLEKEEISLGMKQTEQNPWEMVEEKYPPGTVIKGRVRNLANYGAFVEIEAGIDGLLHISDMSWTKKVTHPSEMLKKGDKIDCVVLSVNQEKKRVALGLKQLQPDPWQEEIPNRYRVGDVVTGTATKLTSFGVFVELEPDLEGLLHISELAVRKVETPEEVVQQGEEMQVRIIRVDPRERKIGLSLRQVEEADMETLAAAEEQGRVPEGGGGEQPAPSGIEGLDRLRDRVSGEGGGPSGSQGGRGEGGSNIEGLDRLHDLVSGGSAEEASAEQGEPAEDASAEQGEPAEEASAEESEPT